MGKSLSLTSTSKRYVRLSRSYRSWTVFVRYPPLDYSFGEDSDCFTLFYLFHILPWVVLNVRAIELPFRRVSYLLIYNLPVHIYFITLSMESCACLRLLGRILDSYLSYVSISFGFPKGIVLLRISLLYFLAIRLILLCGDSLLSLS